MTAMMQDLPMPVKQGSDFSITRGFHFLTTISEFRENKKICALIERQPVRAWINYRMSQTVNEPVPEISNNVVCATSKASDQPAHTHSLIRAFASCLSIL